MTKRFLAVALLATAVAGCNGAAKKLPSDQQEVTVSGAQASMLAAPKDVAIPPFVPPPEVQIPQASVRLPPKPVAPATTGTAFIAYSYKLGFELPAKRLDAIFAAHRAACEALGPGQCQLLNSSRSGGDGDAVEASLDLRITPTAVKGFEAKLQSTTTDAGGTLLNSSVAGEDLTGQIIDADAALKAKRTLRDRLQTLLERHDGKLADLLEVEKSLSETQQELDAATALRSELQQRIAFSKLSIAYRSERPIGSTTARPLADAVAGAGQTISASLALLLTTSLALLPWLLPIGFVVILLRRQLARRAARRIGKTPATL